MITASERIELYAKARKKWGLESQNKIAIEELGELIVEICHTMRKIKCHDKIALIEEIADAQLTIEQLCYNYGVFHHEIREAKQRKLKKLKKLVETEESHKKSCKCSKGH